MDSRDSIFLVSLMIVIPYIVKAYILQVRLTTKDKIVLKYTPKKAFFLINIAFVLSLLNMLYVILIKPSIEYQDRSYFCMMSLLFLWYAIGVLGRRRYLKATGQKMKEIYFHVAVLISGASFFGILYFI